MELDLTKAAGQDWTERYTTTFAREAVEFHFICSASKGICSPNPLQILFTKPVSHAVSGPFHTPKWCAVYGSRTHLMRAIAHGHFLLFNTEIQWAVGFIFQKNGYSRSVSFQLCPSQFSFSSNHQATTRSKGISTCFTPKNRWLNRLVQANCFRYIACGTVVVSN